MSKIHNTFNNQGLCMRCNRPVVDFHDITCPDCYKDNVGTVIEQCYEYKIIETDKQYTPIPRIIISK